MDCPYDKEIEATEEKVNLILRKMSSLQMEANKKIEGKMVPLQNFPNLPFLEKDVGIKVK